GAAGSTAATAFAYARNVPLLKYYMISPHVHAGRTVGDTTLYSDATSNTIRAQADAATTSTFIAVAGQEVSTISSGGHWNLFNALAMVGTDHPDGDWTDADSYYTHVAGLGTAGEDIAAQFNHPTTGDFGNRYVAAAAPYFGTIAVSSGYTGATNTDFTNNGSNLEYATNNPLENLWAHYLGLGWKLSPSADQDNHRATWGASSSEYTVIVRPKGILLNRAGVLKGLREHMTYATEDPNMQIGFLANGWSMGQTIGGSSNVAFTIWWNNPSESVCNNNVPVCKAETANDAIQNIWIYKNSFGTTGDSVGANAGNYVARYQPNTASGTWNVTLPAVAGDWFVVKFQDTYTFASDPTYGRTTSKDLTWSAPVWFDPTKADPQLLVDNGGPTPTPTTPAPPTNTPTPTPTATPPPPSACSAVKINEVLPANSTLYTTEWVELYNPTASAVTIGGCIIDDLVGGGGAPYTIPTGTTIAAYGYWTRDFTNYFNNTGDDVNLIAADGTTVIDKFTFGSTGYDVSWYRFPDGGAWQTTTTSSPTKGSANTLNTGYKSPAAQAADTGGDGDGFQTNPANAFSDNATFAVDTNSGTTTSTACTDAGKDRHRFYNYGLALPAGAVPTGIEVQLHAKVDATTGSPKMCVELSWDGGTTWTTAKTTATLSKSEKAYVLGGSADTWGRAWTLTDVSDANFRVRLVDVASNNARDFSLDWIAVRVSYR
ncbi:MAG: lamin tail domain-containing protein, partial [Acidobacteriota bacterium]